MLKTWLIANYGGPARIVGDIVSNLSKKSKLMLGNRKEKFSFYAAITGSIQRLEACLLSRSTLSSLLPTSEYDLWVREMTVSVLDFRNPRREYRYLAKKGMCALRYLRILYTLCRT